MSRQPGDPADVTAYDEFLDTVIVGGAQPLTKPIELRAYDPE